MTPPADPARVKEIRHEHRHVLMTGDPLPGQGEDPPCTICFLLSQLDRAEAERDDLAARVDHDQCCLLEQRLRAQIATVREALEFYADGANYVRVTLGEEGGGMGHVKYSLVALRRFTGCPQEVARAALTRLDARAEKPGAQGAPEQRELTK